MKIERDRHYYDREGRIWRVVCVDGVKDFPVLAISPKDGKNCPKSFTANGIGFDISYPPLDRPAFEPGQRWKHNDGCLLKLTRFEDWAWCCEIDNVSGFYYTERWLLENCEQVKDEPEYIDVQQSQISTLQGQLRVAQAEIERLKTKHDRCKEHARTIELKCGEKSQALEEKDRELTRLEYQVRVYQDMIKKMKQTLEGGE